ncbi:MAG: 50S ribosomal protein L25 [Armatimonadota bacterium]
MELVPLKVAPREQTGKGPARRLRAVGLIPGVVYGLGRDTVHLSVARRALESIHGGAEAANVLIDLDVPGVEREASVAAMVKEVQRDPVTREPLSVDFQWVSLREEIEVEVPVEVSGTAPGVEDDGGVVQQQLHSIAVVCLPTAIPERIIATIDGMHIGNTLHVRDLPQLEGVRYVPEGDEVVLSIAPPISEAELESRVEEEMLESLVELEVGEEVEELTPERPGGAAAEQGAEEDAGTGGGE